MFRIKSERIAIYKRIYPFLKNQKPLYITLAGLKVFGLVLSLISPIFYMMLINDVMVEGKLNMLIWVVAGYVGIYLLQSLSIVLNKITYNTLFIKFNLKLRTTLISRLGHMKTADIEKYDTGDIKNRVEGDAGIFEKFLMSHCLDYIYAISSAVVIVVILLYLNWILALFGFVMVPLSFWFAKFMSKKAGKVSNEYRENYGKYEGFLHSAIQNWKEIKANNLEKHEVNLLSKHWSTLSKLFVKNQIYWYINRSFVAFKDFFITKMNLYFLGGLLIIYGRFQVAPLLVFMSYYEQFFGNISTITDLIIGLRNDKPSIDRVLEILDYNELKRESAIGLSNEIAIENVSFHYPKSDAVVINKVCLNVFPKEHIAIVGRSGCGKSTLAKLILGVYEPNQGQVRLGQRDIQEIEIGHKIGIVMQEPVLFNLSIRENLRFAKRSALQEELDDACEKADILDFIRDLPEQYETVIGERGIKLSGGQKQRLAIARAILFNPDIIIFDEATSSLDQESEKAILNAIKHLSQGKTVVTIAHRLSSILDANRVAVMDEGKIVAIGTHKSLMGNNIVYDLLFQKQHKEGVSKCYSESC